MAPYSLSDNLVLLTEDKRAARARAIEARACCDPAVGGALVGHFFSAFPHPPRCIAGFWPLPGEIDLTALLRALHDAGRRVVLPVTPPRGAPLSFRLWDPRRAMLPGRFGTRHPDGPELSPDLLLIPLLAFDRHGGRLGYGGGYYDRTLPLLPAAVRVGCGFAAQERPAVPMASHDQRLQYVLTEAGAIHCRPPAAKDDSGPCA